MKRYFEYILNEKYFKDLYLQRKRNLLHSAQLKVYSNDTQHLFYALQFFFFFFSYHIVIP